MGVDGGEYYFCRKRGVGFGSHICRAGFLCETALGDFRVGDAIENGTRQSRAPLRAVAGTRAPAERPVSLDDRITDCRSCRLACLAEITEGGSRHSCAAAEGSAKAGSILLCRLRYSLSFARRFRRLWSSSVTNSTALFGSGRSALASFLAFLTQLLLVQISLVLFIGKTTAQTSGGNGQSRCNFYRPATRYHMPWAFRQRIAIRKR